MQITKYTHACIRLEHAGRVLVIDVTWVTSGETFDAVGFKVRAVGDRHAFIYGGLPDCPNLGYVVDDRIYHPGDALFVPEQPIDTLFVPAQGPWLKLAEAIDFVHAIGPRQTFPIHDAGMSERGMASVNAWYGRVTDSGYRWLAPGETTQA